MLKKLDFAGNC